jgi:hypothetical protein
MVAWALGIVAYHVTNPSTLASMFPVWTKLVPQVLTLIGGSIPSFVLSFIAYLAIQAILRTRRNPA